MQPYNRYESTGPINFPGAFSQATPSITPSNFQSIAKSPPKIFGRKIDSPTLLVVNDNMEDGGEQLELERVQNDLNKTNKVFNKKPLEITRKTLGSNVPEQQVATIQYESQPVNRTQRRSSAQVNSKPTTATQKTQKVGQTTTRRPTHSATRTTSMPTTITGSKQTLKKNAMIKKKVEGPKRIVPFKTNQPQQQVRETKHKKNKSEMPQKIQKSLAGKKKKASDKENMSINIGSQVMQAKHQANTSMVIPHGSNNQGFFFDRNRKSKEEILQSSLGKPKDKGQRVKVLDVSISSNKSSPQKKVKSPVLGEVKEEAPTQQSQINHYKQLRLKRGNASTSCSYAKNARSNINKSQNVDLLIKNNLKKQKQKEEMELMKKYLEDFKQKQKKQEQTQRNADVRKINASKILQIAAAAKPNLYKKQRSKSCMNKTDSLLRANKYNDLSVVQQVVHAQKKEKKREKSFVLEMKELQKEVGEEIKREIQDGKIDLTRSNKKTNLTSLNASKPLNELKAFQFNNLNSSMVEPGLNDKQKLSGIAQITKPKPIQNAQLNIKKPKIRQYIEHKKKAQIAKKSLENTIEAERQLKVQSNLKKLNNYVLKQHARHSSHNSVLIKKKDDLNNTRHIKQDIKTGSESTKRRANLAAKFMEQLYKEDFEAPTSSERKRIINMDVSQEFIDEYIKILKSSHKGDKKKRRTKKGGSKKTSPKKVVVPNVMQEFSGLKEDVGLFGGEISMIPESPDKEANQQSYQNYKNIGREFQHEVEMDPVPNELEPESPEEDDQKLQETVKKLTSPQSFATQKRNSDQFIHTDEENYISGQEEEEKKKSQKEFQQPSSSLLHQANEDKVVNVSVFSTQRNNEDSSQRIPGSNPLKYEEVHYNPLSDSNDPSNNTPKIPVLDLNKLKQQEKPVSRQQEQSKASESQRSIFDRKSFQEFKKQHKDMDMGQQSMILPEFIQMREEAIKQRQTVYQNCLKKMVEQDQMTPRTYKKKQYDLECWVKKEKDEVKKTKKVFQEQWVKTKEIIELTQQNQDNITRILPESSQRSKQGIINSQRASQRKREELMDMIKSHDERLSGHVMGINSETSPLSSPSNNAILKKKEQELEQEKIQRELLQQKIKDLEEQRIKSEKERLQLEQQALEAKKKTEKDLEQARKLKEAEDEAYRKAQEIEKFNKEQARKAQEKYEQELQLKKKQEQKQKEEEEKRQRQLQEEEDRRNELKRLEKEKLKREEDELRKLREQIEIEEMQKKREEIERERKALEEKQRLKEQKRLEELEQQRLAKQSLRDVDPKQNIAPPQSVEEKNDLSISEMKSEPDFFEAPSQKKRDEEFIQRALDLDEEEEIKNNESIPPSPVDDPDEELKNRQLTRTRSSGCLANASQEDSRTELQPIHQQPIETDEINLQVEKDLDIQPVKKENFFSQDFDTVQPSDVMKKLQETTSQNELPANLNQLPAELRDENFYQEKEPSVMEVKEETGLEELKSHKLGGYSSSDQQRVAEPDLNVNTMLIQTGSQSLESTYSEGTKLKEELQKARNEIKEEDKSQGVVISQEIFSYLIEELKVELDVLLTRNFNTEEDADEEVEAKAQGPNGLLQDTQRFLIFDRQGIQTDLFAIERYVDEILEEVLANRDEFMKSIQIPLTADANKMLNTLQNSEIGSYEHFQENYPQVLQLNMYLTLEKRRKELREIQEGKQENNLVGECEHIHNKVLFDCINDSLLQFKPFGKEGPPFPWTRSTKRLKPTEDFTIEEMFEIVKHDLFRWAIMQAGTLPRKEFVFGGVFDDELFAEIREKKLATMLAREMIENEPKWLQYEFEEAQVKIDIGDMILEQMVTETISFLQEKTST